MVMHECGCVYIMHICTRVLALMSQMAQYFSFAQLFILTLLTLFNQKLKSKKRESVLRLSSGTHKGPHMHRNVVVGFSTSFTRICKASFQSSVAISQNLRGGHIFK